MSGPFRYPSFGSIWGDMGGSDPHPLAPFYGTGPGQIGIHLSTDGATLDDDGRVTALTNAGGAGAAFDATIISGDGLPISGSYLEMQLSGSFPKMASLADLHGVHMIWAMQVDTSTRVTIFSNGSNYMHYMPDGSLAFQARPAGTWLGEVSLTGPPRDGSAHVFELRLADGAAELWVDGQLHDSQPAAQYSQYTVDQIGRARNASESFDGLMGDVLGVILGPGQDDSIAAARGYLMDRFGVALS